MDHDGNHDHGDSDRRHADEDGPTQAKAVTARDSWCASVNNHAGFGRWGYVEAVDVYPNRTLLPAIAVHFSPTPFCVATTLASNLSRKC